MLVASKKNTTYCLCVPADGVPPSREKLVHGLFLFVFPNPEILGGEIANVVSFFVGDNRIHQNQLGFRSDDVSGIGGRIGFGRLSRQRAACQAEHGCESQYASNTHGTSFELKRNLDHAVAGRHGLPF